MAKSKAKSEKQKSVKVKIFVKPKEGILNPQGKTVEHALHSLNYRNVENMKIGKYIELDLALSKNTNPDQEIKKMCEQLLANPVIEDYSFEVLA